MNNFQDDLPIHLLHEFEEMASALKRMVECPVCLEVIPSGHLNIILASRGGKRAQKTPNIPKSWGAEQKNPKLPQ